MNFFGKWLCEFHFSATEIEKVLDFVKLCVRRIAFVFSGVFSPQIKGLGGPLSLHLCVIYMHYFEEKFFIVHKFPHWFRYMDDILFLLLLVYFLWAIKLILIFNLLLKSKNMVASSFLDMLVSKYKNRPSTTVFKIFFSVSLPPHAF